MEARAIARFQRYSPRKVAQVLDLIRRKEVTKAFAILQFVNKRAKILIQKTLRSAVANAGKIKNPAGIFVKECYVGQGPALKRWRARAFGRAAPYKHRTCHLTIVVSDEK
ncbi:MAG: 50S ribosomal protein L22 [Elusimicrobiota bacterium]|nr:50S ribosomal protein L22 [Elusimicrobiota bacterium]